jgi:hypothetical protein
MFIGKVAMIYPYVALIKELKSAVLPKLFNAVPVRFAPANVFEAFAAASPVVNPVVFVPYTLPALITWPVPVVKLFK